MRNDLLIAEIRNEAARTVALDIAQRRRSEAETEFYRMRESMELRLERAEEHILSLQERVAQLHDILARERAVKR